MVLSDPYAHIWNAVAVYRPHKPEVAASVILHEKRANTKKGMPQAFNEKEKEDSITEEGQANSMQSPSPTEDGRKPALHTYKF